MARIQIVTEIRATPLVCFDRARDLDLHARSMQRSGERAVAGKTSGLIGLGEKVTWRARHFGVVHEHAARITAFEPPRHFRDEMIRGRFERFRHDHHFEPCPAGTRMVDSVEFQSPLGALGRLVDRLVMERYLTRLLLERADAIRRAAEAHPIEDGEAR